MIARVLVGNVALEHELAVFRVRGRLGRVVQQVDLVGHRGVGLVGGAGKRAHSQVALGRKDVGGADLLVGIEHDRAALHQVVVLVDVVLVVVAVGLEVKVERLELGERLVVIRDPEVARVLAVLDDAPVAATLVGKVLPFCAPAVLNEPGTIVRGRGTRALGRDGEVARIVIVVPAHDGHGVIRFLGCVRVVGPVLGDVLGDRALRVHRLLGQGGLSKETAGHGAILVADLALDGLDGALVHAQELAVLVKDARLGQDVAVLELVGGLVPQLVRDRPVRKGALAVRTLHDTSPADGAHDDRVVIGLELRDLLIRKIASGLRAALLDEAELDALGVLIGRVRFLEWAHARRKEIRGIHGETAAIEPVGGILGIVVEALARLRGAHHRCRCLCERTVCELQLRKVEAGVCGLAGLGKDARLAGGDGGESPAAAPRALVLDRGHHAVAAVAVAVGIAQVVLLGQ